MFKKVSPIFWVLPFVTIVLVVIGSHEVCAQYGRPDSGSDTVKELMKRQNGRNRSTSGSRFPSTTSGRIPTGSSRIPSTTTQMVGTCSKCNRTIRGSAARGSKCPYCGVRWINRSSAASSRSRPPQFTSTGRARTSTPGAESTPERGGISTASVVLLIMLLGGLLFVAVMGAMIYVVVTKSIDDNKRHSRRGQRKKVRYRDY